MLTFITRALSKPAQPRAPHAAYDPNKIRAIVSERAHGNVRLQNGRFYTKDDVDEQYKRVKGFDFLSK